MCLYFILYDLYFYVYSKVAKVQAILSIEPLMNWGSEAWTSKLKLIGIFYTLKRVREACVSTKHVMLNLQ